ncbi:hypothetical protein F444_07030 [Phytophthora nicotianae P1976]|uniref:Uncharacterized protein n=1 Tax=Phytophthora nicotianae P1976 TaxID=1317066 RepID=A0A081AG40_PHYNI|nr:hypothetical protein F444_07030 [Phytophthora nicotianae P1976]
MSFDPSKLMEHLANLSEQEQAAFTQNILNRAEEMEHQAQQSRTREGLIQQFKKKRSTFVRPGGIYAEKKCSEALKAGAVPMGFTLDDTKPKSDMRLLKTLKPMLVEELELGTVHRGRYLCGWVAIDDAFFSISATSLLLEDVTGDLVELAVYGILDSELPLLEKQCQVASGFPKGRAIVVLEPYYKVRMDGTVGIRVDESEEIISWRDVPTDLVTWKNLGNDFFSTLNCQNEGRGALACYQRAIQAEQPDVSTLAQLLNNIATCRFKKGDYGTAVQLSGAAVHLDPTNFKGWLRLASSLGENGAETIAARVVAHARNTLPNILPKQLQLLQNTVKTGSAMETSRFRSFAEWCCKLASPGLVKCGEELSGNTETAEVWREKGSDWFAKGDLEAAEECYRKGISACASCCHDVSLVLNNIAAVHLMTFRDSKDVPGISSRGFSTSSEASEGMVPNAEMALLNSTTAGIISPLNHKAWTRRVRCMESLGMTQAECISDLKAIHSSILSTASFGTFGTEENKKIQEFKRNTDAEIQRRSQQHNKPKSVHKVSETPTHVQREQRDTLRPESIAAAVKSNEKNVFTSSRDEDTEDIDEYIARMEKLENITRFAFAASDPQQQKKLPREVLMFVKNPPPQVHVEFPKQRGWPSGIDATFARKALYRAYLNASSSPWMTASVMREGAYFANIDPADMIKRWHGTAAMQILYERSKSLRFGDIIDAREVESGYIPAYDARIRSNFANNPNRAEVYFFGTTHVAIGFNDFSSLLAATLHDEQKKNLPLKFVGFERSEFTVAKCKIVAQMLALPEIPIWSVMEVWLSSTWSETTLKHFRQTANKVLESTGQNENSKVISYLKHWVSAKPISGSKARSEFFRNLEKYNKRVFSAVYCFRREIDRLDLTQYMLTGEVHASPNAVSLVETQQEDHSEIVETSEQRTTTKKRNRKKKKDNKREASVKSTDVPLVGSLTMWNVPSGAPPLEEDIMFNTVNFTKILDDCAAKEKTKKKSTENLSVVDLFTIHIIQNLDRLRGLMRKNKLTIEVHYGVVKAVRGEAANDLENQHLLSRIALMRPYTMSWSNVLDYFIPEDFHDVARRCSIFGDCLHYGYSMNWPTQVFGASILDYDFEDCKPFIDGLLDAALGFRVQSHTLAFPLMDIFKIAGLDKLVLLPFRENPLNSTGYLLANVYKQKWVDYFMSKGELSVKAAQRLGSLCTPTNSGLQMGSMELAMPSPLYRTSTTLYMSWCYDPEIRLQVDSNPFQVGAATDIDMLARTMQQMRTDM